jgi:hypothetical protein
VELIKRRSKRNRGERKDGYANKVEQSEDWKSGYRHPGLIEAMSTLRRDERKISEEKAEYEQSMRRPTNCVKRILI